MNLLHTANQVTGLLKKKQDPDEVQFTKQWNEFGQLNGFWVQCRWHGEEDNVTVSFDVTDHQTRIVGDLDQVPDYKPGSHQLV